MTSRDEHASGPLVSVFVCTCNRKQNILPTIQSMQACGYPKFELFVLDQSHDDTTELAVRDLCREDPRLVYSRLGAASKPGALNHGLRFAKGRYILLTDDDCTVSAGWIGEIVRAFETSVNIGCVFGDVEAAPHDATCGYIPENRITQARAIFRLSEFLTMPGRGNFGMGANMALRADVLSTIGGWDPTIGPGTAFPSGDDNDVGVRVLTAGWGIAFCPSAHVVHYGFRLWGSMSRDNARYGFGMGAVFAKQLRCGTYYPGGCRILWDALLISLRRLWKGERPLALAYPRSWFRGFLKGLRYPLNRQIRCFVPDERQNDSGGNTVAEVILRDQQEKGDYAGRNEVMIAHVFHASVIVPTRNRPAHAAACAASILATDGFEELIVVDQSDDQATVEALSKIDDPRLHYVRTNTRGVTNSRNLGIELSRGDLIAFTDDDCRVRPDWIRRIVEVFSDDDVAIVCGRVCVPSEIQRLGYAETFEPRVREWQHRYPPWGQDWGLTANFAIRRFVFDRVGRFDPILGVGAPLRAGEEPDLIFRALRAGLKVVNAEEVVVDHLGIREPGPELKQLILGYAMGTGAALFKHVRLGDRAGMFLYLRFLGSSIQHVLISVIRGRRPTGANYLRSYLAGTLASCQFRVDRKTREYVVRGPMA